jgi:hypothetical protein
LMLKDHNYELEKDVTTQSCGAVRSKRGSILEPLTFTKLTVFNDMLPSESFASLQARINSRISQASGDPVGHEPPAASSRLGPPQVGCY